MGLGFRAATRGPVATFVAVLAVALAQATAARAAWVKAETDRFVVYGDGDPKTVADYASKLTVFDEALRALHPGVAAQPDRQKVSVYLVRTEADLHRVAPGAYGIGGFYTATPGAVAAVVWTTGKYVDPETTLFHEYAHHFMLENFPSAYPRWFVEAWAEYFSTAQIKPEGVVVGGYNKLRLAWLVGSQWITLRTLLTDDSRAFELGDNLVFYAEGWFFLHYMKDSPVRAAQLDKAMQASAQGADPVVAMEAATGETLTQLRDDLRAYKVLQTLLVPAKMLDMHPKIEVADLSPAANDLVLERLRLELAAPGSYQEGLLGTIRRQAARHPGDRFADLVLAHAEFALGDTARGETIVDRLLKANPDDPEALFMAGLGQVLAGERDRAHRSERFRAARPLLIKAYGLDNSDFRILYEYALSRSVEAGYPDDNDLQALIAAHQLAPAVAEVSVKAGEALLVRGRHEDAATLLKPVANNPHGGREAAEARALLDGKSQAEAEAAGEAAARHGS